MRSPQSDSDDPVQINPDWLDRERYVEFLNHVFPGQWSPFAYDWYIGRPFNSWHNDILVCAEGRRVLCGVTLCYRQICVGTGAPVRVCVLSAGGTLAAERGRGHYAVILQRALERCREKGCVAALGFVTRGNGSGRGLVRTGARAIPSYYVVSPDAQREGRDSAARRPGSRCSGPSHRADGLRRDFESQVRLTMQAPDSCNVPRAQFHYERDEDWRQQFLQRPNTVHIVRLAHDSYAAIEAVQATDRLQLLVCPDGKRARNIAALASASAAAGRKFFMYTLEPAEAAAARRARLRIRAGYLMLQPTGAPGKDWERLATAAWRVQSGDRM